MELRRVVAMLFLIVLLSFSEGCGSAGSVTSSATAPTDPNSFGTISTYAGTNVRGETGDGGLAKSAELYDPSCLAVNAAGDVFVGDEATSVVRKIDAKTGIITLYAGVGSNGYQGNGVPATQAQFYDVGDCTLDKAGNLYIADVGNNIIRRIDAVSGMITTVAGKQYETQSAGSFGGDGGQATSAFLNRPNGVTVDASGNLYIADTYNYRIRRVDAKSGVITTIAGNGQYGWSGDGGQAVAAALYNPLGVTLDASGNLFIAEQANYDVRRVDMQTGTITTVAGDPTNANAPVSGNNGPATKAVLGDAEKVVFDASGNMFISSWGAQCIWEVKAGSSTIIRAVGNGQQGYKGDGGPATSASISDPEGIGFDAIGNMYIAESANSVVRKVTH